MILDQKSKNPKIQKSENPEILESKNPEIQKSKNPEIQKSKNPEIQKSRNPKIQKSKNLEIQKWCFVLVLVMFLVPETNTPTLDPKTVIQFFRAFFKYIPY